MTAARPSGPQSVRRTFWGRGGARERVEAVPTGAAKRSGLCDDEEERTEMKIVTASQMRELERIAFDEYGFSSLVMMENAAQGFCDKLEQETGKVCGKKINIFCGRGNNGGDGFAIARLLSVRGAQVTVLIGFDTDRLSGDARVNYELAARFGISISEFSELAGACDIAVDALYGTGFHGEITGAEAEMVRLMNGCGAFVAAVDMPSGASAEDGSVAKICVRADLTVTFGAAKLGQFLYPAKKQAGRVVVSEISIPRKVWDEYDSGLFTLDEEIWERIPRREENTHKGSYGKVLLFAGSKGMCGAGVMAAEAVMKSGAGMATLAVPKGIADIAAAKLTEVMTMALPSDGDAVAKSALTMLTEKLQQQEVLLMGCGLGASENVEASGRAVGDRIKKACGDRRGWHKRAEGEYKYTKPKKSAGRPDAASDGVFEDYGTFYGLYSA